MVGTPLAAQEVAVWYWRTRSLTEADLLRLSDVLTAEEKARRDQFGFARDRLDFAAAHALLRHALSRYASQAPADWRFQRNPHGKPALIPIQAGNPALSFSLSHAEGFVACAVGLGTRLGIDIEQVSSRIEVLDIARNHFSLSEIHIIEKAPPDKRNIRFCEIWTLKEAYLKAVGCGLASPIDSFSVGFDDASGLRFSCNDDSAKWQFLLAAPSAETRLALAVDQGHAGNPWRICLHTVPEPSGNSETIRIIAAS